MIPSWEQDPFGFFLAICIFGFTLALGATMLSFFGGDLQEDADPSVPEDPSFAWWLTEGPEFYPGVFASGAFMLMLLVFKVYMHVG